jgi:SAM-dependent methyltransferase
MTMFRQLSWWMAKRRLASPLLKPPPAHVRVSRRAQQERVKDLPPNAEGYERLASVWNDFAGWFVPGYGRFLASASAYYWKPITTVLDLACGTGILTRRLARRFERVVGLDFSEAMLHEARSQRGHANIRYVQGDFRSFHLEETFDAVVCSSDSLNYLQSPEQLTEVFRCVAQHSCPGGLFCFDGLDHQAFEATAGSKVFALVSDEPFEIYAFYDADRRTCENRVVFLGITERHARIPIEEEDVRRSAREAGLEVAEAFSAPVGLYLLRRFAYRRRYYLLRKP